MTPEIGLSAKSRETVVAVLNRLLADEIVLQAKTRNYHWNVSGPLFAPMHELFGAQYDELTEIVDEVAERARQLGGLPAATLTEALELTRLAEAPGEVPEASAMLARLLADHEAIIRSLRESVPQVGEDAGDAGTEDFLVGLMEKHEKTAWFLRSHLG